MAQPYVGEIRMFAGNFAPAGWMFCEGQLLPISENETLFNLIGTTYGGDGQTTFALPDLRGRVPIGMGQGSGLTARQLAETGGTESVTLTTQQIPSHNHAMVASNDIPTLSTPANNVTGQAAAKLYRPGTPSVALDPQALGTVGGSQPHTNFQPYLCVDFIISLFGIFPFNFAPRGWAWCDGQLLPLSQNTALFSLLGTTYGGDGKSNFALPDLQGAAPMHPGQGPGLSLHDLGEQSGSTTVTLLESEIPAHTHSVGAQTTPLGTVASPTGATLGRPASGNLYFDPPGAPSPLVAMDFSTIGVTGGSQPHNNMQPYLTLYFNIALQGVFPPRT